MAIEEKLNQIIAILLRIEGKLNGPADHDADQEHLQQQRVVYKKETKPTAFQLKFQSQMEFNISMNRKFFLKAIRDHASKLMEIREIEPDFKISYTDENTLRLVDEKIARYPDVIFYRDLKLRILRRLPPCN